jgi:hypothetical protein
MTHYRFFRDVFTGKAFDSDEHVWDPGPDYPAHDFKRQTAYTAFPNTIPDPNVRRLAWLSDLHYWIILCLLDVAYRTRLRKLAYKAIDNMTLALWHLGRHLSARHQTAPPFDQTGLQYALGRSNQMSLHILRRLVEEAARKAEELRREGLLPPEYDVKLFESTLDGIERLATAGKPTADEVEYRFA